MACQIVIWESRGEIIRACERSVCQALKELNLKGTVIINSEPPSIARNQLCARLPVLEIDDMYWSLRPGCAFEVCDLKRLFSKLFADQIAGRPIHQENRNLVGNEREERQEMLTQNTFGDEELITKLARETGILFFYKKKCPNCKAMDKVVEKFLTANPEVNIISIDSEECPKTMKAFDTQLVPTFCILNDGKVVGKKTGLMNPREMTAFYNESSA